MNKLLHVGISDQDFDGSYQPATLRGWRRSRPARRNLGLLVTTIFLLAFILAIFVYSLTYPFYRPNVRVVIFDKPYSELNTRDVLRLDFAALLASSSSRKFHQAVSQKYPASLIHNSGHDYFDVSLGAPKSLLSKAIHRESTLLVYAAGIISVADSNVSLRNSSREATEINHPNSLLKLIRELRSIPCKNIVLCIDSVSPFLAGPTNAAVPISFKLLNDQIERSVSRDEGTPIAVCFHLTDSTQAVQSSVDATQLSKSLAMLLDSQANVPTKTIADFQEQLGLLIGFASAERDSLPAALSDKHWIVSSNWPLVPTDFRLPSRITKSSKELDTKEHSSGPKSSARIAQKKSERIDSVANFEDQFDSCTQIFDAWEKTSPQSAMPQSFLPQAISRHQSMPIITEMLRDEFVRWKALHAMQPEAFPEDRFYQFASCLERMNRNEPLPKSAPQWARWMESRWHKPPQVTGPSLVANETLQRLGLTSANDTSENTIQVTDLVSKIQECSTELSFQQWITSLPSEVTKSTELIWANQIISVRGIDWSTKQYLILNRLLSTRLCCDPITLQYCAENFEEANRSRLNAERWIIDRSHQHWQIEANKFAFHAFNHFHECVEITNSVRRLHQIRLETFVELSRTTSLNRNLSPSVELLDPDLTTQTKQFLEVTEALSSKDFSRINALVAQASSLKQSTPGSTYPPKMKLVSVRKGVNELEKVHEARVANSSSAAQQNGVPKSFDDQFGTLLYSVVSSSNPNLADQYLRESEAFRRIAMNSQESTDRRLKAIGDYSHFTLVHSEQYSKWLFDNFDKLPFDCASWLWIYQLNVNQREQILDCLNRRVTEMQEVVAFNLHRVTNEKRGATREEHIALESEEAWWRSLVNKSRISSTPNELSQNLIINAPSQISLSTKRYVSFPIKLNSNASSPDKIAIRASFDDERLSITIDERELKKEQTLVLTKNANGDNRYSVTVRLRQDSLPTQPLLLYANQGKHETRAVIDFDSTSEEIVRLNYKSLQSTNESSTGERIPSMFAGQNNSIALKLTNLMNSHQVFQAEVYLTDKQHPSIPLGSLSKVDAERWLIEFSLAKPIATSKPLPLNPSETGSIVFPPAAWPEDQTLLALEHAIVVVRSEQTGAVQFSQLTPRIVRPSRYVEAIVSTDPIQRVVDFQVSLMPSAVVSRLGHQITVSLHPVGSIQPVASSSTVLTEERRSSRLRLTAASLRSNEAIAVVAVDGWPSSFVYRLDLNNPARAIPTNEYVCMHVRSSQQDQIVDTQAASLPVDLLVHINEDSFDADRDLLQVGVDRQINRTLDDDIKLSLKTAFAVRAFWNGTDADGALSIKPVVMSHQLSLPLQLEWDQACPAMAVLRRGQETIYSNSEPFVFDKHPPAIENVRIINDQPCVLGLPLSIESSVNDFGLSGSAVLEAGWSIAGDLEFKKGAPIIQGIYRQNDRWIVTVPTEGMPSGFSTLLLRARDRAGNQSSTYAVPIEMLTEQEIRMRKTSITTFVTGTVMYRNKPLAGMKIQIALPRKEDPKPIEANSSSTTTSKDTMVDQANVLASTTTGSDGVFLLNGIPSGIYQVDVSGIVKGMREKQTVTIQVDAPSVPGKIHFSMDKKP